MKTSHLHRILAAVLSRARPTALNSAVTCLSPGSRHSVRRPSQIGSQKTLSHKAFIAIIWTTSFSSLGLEPLFWNVLGNDSVIPVLKERISDIITTITMSERFEHISL